MALDRLSVAGASRAYPGESINGDAWQVDWHAERCRISIVDGLGHGPRAADATTAALRVLSARPELSPEDALRACHDALRATRGAAMSIVRIDLELGQLAYSGVGNTEAKLFIDDRCERLTYRGIVGATFPRLRTFSFALEPNWTLVMFTDGVRSHFDVNATPAGSRQDARHLAEDILQAWARDTDDATVVVARGTLDD
jgi:serine phosphatase RsbU (regulator of sigma subunit)